MLQHPCRGGGIVMTARATELKHYLTDCSFEEQYLLPGSYFFFEESYINVFEK